MIRRFIPHPHLSVMLLLVWLGLVNTVSLGNIILGAVFGIVVPMMTAAYWPDRPKIRRHWLAVEYMLIVLWDIVVANVEVAMIILFKPTDQIRSQWINVRLEPMSAEAITVLAGTITMTPGTVSSTLAADGGSILVHCLHTDDPDEVRDTILKRYASRLQEIFQ